MSGLSQYEGWTIADIVTRNSHELTARHVLTAQREIKELIEQHAAEQSRLRSQLSDFQRIGLAVLREKQRGRKTVRIADVAGDVGADS